MVKRRICKKMVDMGKISNRIWENMSIDEIYKYRTQCGELQCHRINMPNCMAGELIINVPMNEKAFTIEEVFVDRKFGNTGMGSRLLAFAEETALASGFTGMVHEKRIPVRWRKDV